MVKQKMKSLTSSAAPKHLRSAYVVSSPIIADWEQLEWSTLKIVKSQPALDGTLREYLVKGESTGQLVEPRAWKTPPHRYFVNLHVIANHVEGTEVVDPKEMIGFIKRYGVLHCLPDEPHHSWTQSKPYFQFVEPSVGLKGIAEEVANLGEKEALRRFASKHSLTLLQYAWRTGNREALAAINDSVMLNLKCTSSVDGTVLIRAADAWTLLCWLILRDHAAGSLGVCANPDCPAPLFLKGRKTQKICEQGDCVTWAQRSHARKWWRRHRSRQPES